MVANCSFLPFIFVYLESKPLNFTFVHIVHYPSSPFVILRTVSRGVNFKQGKDIT